MVGEFDISQTNNLGVVLLHCKDFIDSWLKIIIKKNNNNKN